MSINLDIVTGKCLGENCLYLNFKGEFTELASIESTRFLISEFESQKPEKISMIWDCTYMTGFELKARKKWYKFLKQYNKNIKSVTVISQKLMIRGAARVMFELFGIESKIIKSTKQLSVKFDPN